MFDVYNGLIIKLIYKHILYIVLGSLVSLFAVYIAIVAAAMESLDGVTVNRPHSNIEKIIDTTENKELTPKEYCSKYFCPNKKNSITIVSDMYEKPYIVRFFTFFQEDLKITIFNHQYMIVVDFNHYRDKMMDLYIKLASIFVTLYIVGHIITTINRHKSDVVTDKNCKSDITVELQKDLTESLHHELALPLAVIKTKTKDLFIELDNYIQKINDNLVQDGSRKIDELYTLSNNELPKKIKDIKDFVSTSIESIDSTLEIIASKRKMTSTYVNTPFFDVLNITLKMYKSFQVKKIEYTILNKDVFKSCYVTNGLGNGNIINMLTIMLNNSVEANGNNLIFSGRITPNKKYLELEFKDDGNGIDLDKQMELTSSIFRFGYSTKVNNNNNNNNRILRAIIRFLDPDLLTPSMSHRGAGLSLVKQVLNKHDGDVRLLDTSSKGTTFLLSIPVKVF